MVVESRSDGWFWRGPRLAKWESRSQQVVWGWQRQWSGVFWGISQHMCAWKVNTYMISKCWWSSWSHWHFQQEEAIGACQMIIFSENTPKLLHPLIAHIADELVTQWLESIAFQQIPPEIRHQIMEIHPESHDVRRSEPHDEAKGWRHVEKTGHRPAPGILNQHITTRATKMSFFYRLETECTSKYSQPG